MHFEQGRSFARAVQYRRQASEHALRRHGYREAVEHLRRAIDVLKALPDSQERRQQELVLQVMRGSALTALEGHAAGDVAQAYARARELCEQVDDTPRLFPVLLGLGWFYLLGGSLDAARDVGKRLASMAEASRDPAIRLAAHNVLGAACFNGGEFETALDHFDRGIALYDPAAHSPLRSSAFRNVLDPGASCTAHAGWTLWMLGCPDRAAVRMREACALADTIAHPFTTAHAYRFAAGFHLSRRERDAAGECADASVAVATEHGFGAVLKAATFLQGWAIAEHGRGEDGIARMREALAVCREMHAESLLPAYLAWLAEVYVEIGRADEALALVSEGLASGQRSGCHYWTAELLRLKGILALASSAEEAASSFQEALTIARRQRAKSFELRAAMSLGRLWRTQRKAAEARALLSDVYGWFTEGFETADLIEAKGLLDELASEVEGPR
jgi:predicted ATPase